MSFSRRFAGMGIVLVWIIVTVLVGARVTAAARARAWSRRPVVTPVVAPQGAAQRLVGQLRTLRHEAALAGEVEPVRRDPFAYGTERPAATSTPAAPRSDVRVLMTVVEEGNSWAKVLAGGQSIRLNVGDTFQGKEVVAIDSGGVVLRGAGGETRLRFR